MNFHEKTLDMAHTEIKECGELRPRVQVILRTGQFFHFDYVGSTEDLDKARDVIIKTIKLARLANRLMFTAFVAEAWTSSRSLPDPMPNVRASEDPERKEAVFAITWEGDKRTISMFDIKRGADKKPELMAMKPFDNFQMWLDRAFDSFPGEVPELLRAAAESWLDAMYATGGRK